MRIYLCVCVRVHVRAYERAHAILSAAKQRLDTTFELGNDQRPHLHDIFPCVGGLDGLFRTF
jgi:hypothetical protein